MYWSIIHPSYLCTIPACSECSLGFTPAALPCARLCGLGHCTLQHVHTWPVWGEAESPSQSCAPCGENVWRSWEPLLPLPWHSVAPSRVSTELSSWGLKLCYPLLINLLKQEELGITPRGLISSQNHLVIKGRTLSAQNGPGSQKHQSQLLPAVERSLRSPSELGPPHLRSMLDGVEIPGGSSWISCMACAPQPLPARLREVNPSRQPR